MGQNKFRTATAIVALAVSAFSLSAPQTLAQDATVEVDASAATNIDAVIAEYQAARDALQQARDAGQDTTDAEARLANAEAELGRLCGILGQDDLNACIAAVTGEQAPAEQPAVEPEAPTEPAPEAAPEPQAEPATEAVPQAEAVEEAPAPTEPSSEMTEQTADEPAASEAVPEPVAEEPETTPAEPVAAAEPAPQPAEAEAVVKAEPSAEPPATNEDVNPSGTPIPRDLSLAVAEYEDANRSLANSVAGTPDAQQAEANLTARYDDIARLCEANGQTDVDTCLAAFGLALTTKSEPIAEAAPVEPEAAPSEEDLAPVLDSAKEAEASPEAEAAAEATPEPEQSEPAPQSDAEAQATIATEPVPSAVTDTGEASAAPAKREQPAEAQVVQQSGPRIVFTFNNQLFVSNQSDQDRLARAQDEIYYEDLPRGRTRETVIRPDGSSVVTIYSRSGDVLQRSRFDQSGNEVVLAYVPDRYADQDNGWYDPGRELPPLRLNIPANDYVLDADRTNLEGLTNFLDSPPVERVNRLYSIDDVKRSARLRDMVRRLEIGDLTFATGSAAIPPDQIGALSIVANAMLELIDKNPAQTFLIEGHTDAVGSDRSNLILSDERAESVAIALTEVFGVPPENIATQGYGERYLKVKTEAAERLNRRVTIRRITPLVAPVNAG